jgi:hypothetical protein
MLRVKIFVERFSKQKRQGKNYGNPATKSKTGILGKFLKTATKNPNNGGNNGIKENKAKGKNNGKD